MVASLLPCSMRISRLVTWLTYAMALLAVLAGTIRSAAAQTLDGDPGLVVLDLPSDVSKPFSISLPLDDEVHTIRLHKRSVRARGFELFTSDSPTDLRPLASPPVRTVRGDLETAKGSEVAGALLETGLHLYVALPDGREFWIEPTPGSNTHRVTPHESLQDLGFACRIHTAGQSHGAAPFGPPFEAACGGDFCVAQLACDADFEFYESAGNSVASSASRIEMVVNVVNLIYERDVNISHVISAIVVRTAPVYPQFGCFNLVDEVLMQWLTHHGTIDRDLVHMFSGKENCLGEGSAYSGFNPGEPVVCDENFHYGVSGQDTTTSIAQAALLAAHEVGHNWGARHCACLDPPFIMHTHVTPQRALRFHRTETIPVLLQGRNAAAPCLDPGVANDEASRAFVICGGVHTGNTSGATSDGSSTCGDSNDSPDVWYSYRPNASGLVTMQTCGSSFDTVLSVHDDYPGTVANQVACDNNSCGGSNSSSVVFLADAGQTYWVRIAGHSGAAGAYQLSVLGPVCNPPVNDDCAHAQNICPGEYQGTTSGATNDGECFTGDTGPDVWFRYTPQHDGILVADTCDSEFDTILSIHPACVGTGENAITCNDTADCGLNARVEIECEGGTTYYIRLSGWAGEQGAYTLGLTGPPCESDLCQNAPLIDSGAHQGTLLGASADVDASCGFSSHEPDTWYRYIAPCDANLVVTTCGTHDLYGVDTGMDTVLAIYDACDVANELACNDDHPTAVIPASLDCPASDQGLQRDSAVSLLVSEGQELLIRVSRHFVSPVDGFILNVSTFPSCEPPNDRCLDATVIGDGHTFGTTSGATQDGLSACDNTQAVRDVWYQYTLPCTARLRVDTCGTFDDFGVDTKISVFTACPGVVENSLGCAVTAPGTLACNPASFPDAAMELNLLAGETIYIRVSSPWDDTGFFHLNVRSTPVNDHCVDALPIVAGSYSGSFGCATFEGNGPCGNTGASADVWYEYSSPTTRIVDLHTCGSNDTGGVDLGTDTVVSVHTGCPNTIGGEFIGCNDNWSDLPDPPLFCAFQDQGDIRDSAMTFVAEAGETYLIRVSHNVGSPATFYGFTLLDRPAHDSCEYALEALEGENTLMIEGAFSQDGASSCDIVGPPYFDVWYQYTAPCDGTLVVDTCGTHDDSFEVVDSLLSIHSGCPGTVATELACNDNWPSSFDPAICAAEDGGVFSADSAVQTAVAGGETVFIRVALNVPVGTLTLNLSMNCGVGFRRGDCNQDSLYDIGDPIYILGQLFGISLGLACADACDTNDDGNFDIGDAIYALGSLFGPGALPPMPHPGCGVDPSADALGCGLYVPCAP